MIKAKTKIIFSGIIIAFLITGVAYASWTDEIVVEAVASSGEMNVEITDSSVNAVSDYVEFTSGDILISEDGKSCNIAVGNNYPGSQVKYSLTITNTGTLPVRLTEVVHSKLSVTDTKTGTNYGQDETMFSFVNAEYYFDVYNAEGTKTDSSAIINTEAPGQWLNSYLVSSDLAEVEPGGYVLLHTRIYFDFEATNEIQNKAFKFSVTPMFTQFS